MDTIKAWDLMESIEADDSDQMIRVFEKGGVRIALDKNKGKLWLVFESEDTEIGVMGVESVYEMAAVLRAADILISK